ncbi:MAG: hypothetical protein QXO72_04255 [Sulfolobales archaeon]
MTALNELVLELVNVEKELRDIKKIMKDLMAIICEIIQEDVDVCDDY